MTIIDKTLSALSIGEPKTYRNLAVFPLYAAEARTPDYLILDEGLEQGACRVTEISEGGSVPELRFENPSDHRILLLDGEELIGARQNRVLNITILVGAGQKIVIPVSCVEQGRWSWASRDFASAKRAMYARGRREKMAQVSASMRASGSRRSHQGQVWESVACKAANMDVHSPTGAMADVYERSETMLKNYRKRFKTKAGQNGAVFALDGQVAGLELFDAPETFGKLFPKLLDSYAMDALESQVGDSDAPSQDQVADFLSRVARANVENFEALAEGRDLRLHGDGIVGGALEADNWVIHLSVFDMPDR
ncbi:MAG: hypothetical protein AMJ59_03910, partial [Gammaproteobacteria bacterium SG8_31]